MDRQQLQLEDSLDAIFDSLNKTQKKVITKICKGKRDIFVSGYGKSLCVHMPVLLQNNSFIIIISSRTTYIKYYSNYFESKQVKTNYLNANTSKRKREAIETDLISKESELKILFITPLQYEKAYFKNILKKIDKKRLMYTVIDEAEKIVSNKENTSTQYLNLELKIVPVPIIAMSAAADFEIQEQIIRKLKLKNPMVYAMPVLKTKLYCDVQFINILLDPMAHLITFIKNCFHLNRSTNLNDKDSLGLVVCHNWEQAKQMAKFLTFGRISTLAYPSCSSKNQRSNCENVDIANVKVISVCETSETLTSSLFHVIAKKSVRFIVYWRALPSIGKYYSLGIKAQCLNLRNYYFYDVNDKSSNSIISSFIQMHCRHKVYSHFLGDTHYECKKYCDVCKEKKELKFRLNLLSEIIHDHSLENLQHTLPEVPKSLNPTCDESVQCGTNVNNRKEHRDNSNLDKKNLECARSSRAGMQHSSKSVTATPSQKSKHMINKSSQSLKNKKEKPIELITIDDDDDDDGIIEEENLDDIVFIEEVTTSRKKRHGSTTQIPESFERIKRRKVS